MKNQLLIIIVMLLFVGCASEPEVPASETEAVVEVPTAEPTATPTAVPTATPEPSPTPTIPPSPTPLTCNPDVLADGIAAIGDLDSYRATLRAEVEDPDTGLLLVPIEAELNVVSNDEHSILEMIMEIAGEENNSFHMILADDRLYIRFDEPGERWQSLDGLMGESLLDQFEDSQYLKPDMIDTLADATCVAYEESRDDVTVRIFDYTDVDVSDVETRGSTMAEQFDELGLAHIQIGLIPFEGVLLPVEFSMTLEVSQEGLNLPMYITQMTFDMNEPLEIAIPEVAPATFLLDVPLPDDAEVLSEGESLLVFTTSVLPSKIKSEYQDYFLNNGWLEVSTSIAEEEGLEFEVFEYERDGVEMAFAVADSGLITIVSVAGGVSDP